MTVGALFPTVTGANLEGREFVLPRDFEGELNLALIAFTQEQQAEVDGWLTPAGRLAGRFPALRVYELPTVWRMPALLRNQLDRWMRAGIPDRAARAATITLYLDKAAFRAALGLAGEGTIHALLVDRAGRVLWRAEGPYSAAKGAALLGVLEGHAAYA